MDVGELIGPVRVGPVAHGGHCVARVEGRAVFVRHVLPGELVTARVSAVAKKYARADVVDVLEVAQERVEPPCPNAGTCGGCDFQHVAPAFQAELKRRVLAEQLQRLAGIEWHGEMEQVSPVLGSRIRMRYAVGADGRLGLRAHRSNTVVPLPAGGCRIADLAMPSDVGEMAHDFGAGAAATAQTPQNPAPSRHDGRELLGVVSVEGGNLFAPRSGATVTQRVGERSFTVDVDGFWQSHRAAPEALTEAVLAGLQPRAGETAFDLYCGVGVFAAALADAGCTVWGIEGSKAAVAHARTNVPGARFLAGDVARTLRKLPPKVDLVVLDPPRAGAGRDVVSALAGLRPRAIGYVACDPAALARDLAGFAESGYRPTSIRGFDLFGMTHHVEAVAILARQA